MSHKSPFTLFYNNMVNSPPPQKGASPFQNQAGVNKNAVNFQTNMSQERSNKSAKKQTKIKVFGLSDKKRNKQDKYKDTFPLTIQAKTNGQKTEEDCNLLQSKTFEKNSLQKGQEGQNKSNMQEKEQSLNQLHKLLGLSDERTPQKQQLPQNQQQYEIKYSTVQKQQSSVSKPRQSRFANISVESVVTPAHLQINLSQKQSRKNQDVSMSKHDAIFNKTQSRYLPSQMSRKEITPFQSKSHSRIIDLIAQLSSNLKTPTIKIFSGSEEISNKNSKILISDFSKLSKRSSAKQSPLNSQKVIKQNNQIIKVKSCQKQLITKNRVQRAQLQFQENFKKTIKPEPQQAKPFVPLPKKRGRKNETNLGEYLNSYGSYQRQVQNLIDRFEKVKQLKQKEVQIKQEINKLTQKNIKTSHDHLKNYYFPEYESVDQKSQQNINLYYTNQFPNKNYHHSEVRKHKKQFSYDSSPATETPQLYENEIQRQLNRNVASMEKILKKFKKISKNIEMISSENSSIIKTQNKLIQTNRRSLLQEHYYKSKHVDKSPSGETQPLKKNTIQPPNINHLNLQTMQNELFQSENMINSREMTENYIQADKKQTTLQQFYSTRIPDKRTSRTEKKYPNVSHKKERQSIDQDCKHSHEQLLKQIKRLNDKVLQLEQKKQKKLSHVKSDNTLRQMRQKFVGDILNASRQQNQSDQQASASVQIPSQINEQSYFYQQKHQNQLSAKIIEPCIPKNVIKTSIEYSKNQTKQKIENPRMKKLHQGEDRDIIQKLKDNLNFPIFYSFPSYRDSLAQLFEIGSYMFRILYKFASARKDNKIKQLEQIESNLKVKKYMNFIHYFIPNELNYHLVYYFKGNIYFGQWQVEQIEGSGYKHGQGYYYHHHKYVYQGQFVFDRKEGYGYVKYANGQIYEGEWRKNKKEGKGILVNALGDSYKGTFKGGKKHGKGREYLSNGDYYKGQFRQGKIQGQGKYVWSDGSIYKGQFKDGKLNGNGVWKSKQNDFYEGKFQDNKKQGEGVYKWNNGVMYAGYFMEQKQKDERDQFKKTRQQRSSKKIGQEYDQKRYKTKERYKSRK